jgi:amino acid transporter
MQATQRAAERVGWPALTPVAAALFVVSGVGGVGAWLGSVARLPFVAGVDRALPAAFGRLHPRWGTPHVSLWVQGGAAAAITLLGQAGTTVKGAYDALVSMAVIAYFVPFLFMFAAMIRLQREPAGPEVIRVPGGRPVAVALAALGFVTTAVSIVLAVLPPPDSDNKPLAVAKVVGMSLLLAGIGAALYARRRRARG